jgi:hypothetical protein
MMVPSEDRRHPMAVAMEWVGRIMAAAAMMVLPGIGGQWIDRRLGTQWITLVGLALGLSLSIYYLLAITRPRDPMNGQPTKRPPTK